MNIIQGLNIQGLSLSTQENFNSIPGLWQWNDARDRIEYTNVSGVNRVTYWGDKSSQVNNFTRRSTTAPFYEKGIWVCSNNASDYLQSNRKDYTFLHNGSKFGIYTIQKNTWSIDNQVGFFGVLNWTNATGVGLQGTLASNQNGRFGFILRGGAVSNVTKTMTNILSVTHSNYTPSDTIAIQSFVNLGQTNGIKITYGNASLTTTPFFTNLNDYPQGSNTCYYCVTGTSGQTVRAGMVLVYNWTGYSDQNVIDFDAKVRTLLNIEKLKFEQLDL